MKTVVLTILVTFAGIAEAAPARLVHTISHIVTKINSEGWSWSGKLANSQAEKIIDFNTTYFILKDKYNPPALPDLDLLVPEGTMVPVQESNEYEIVPQNVVEKTFRKENSLEYAVQKVNERSHHIAEAYSAESVDKNYTTDSDAYIPEAGKKAARKAKKKALQRWLKVTQDKAIQELLDEEVISLDNFLEAILEP